VLIKQLYIDGIRNLKATKLQLDPKVNVFFGLNGSGKTSLLESIGFLALGRSFRVANIDKLISFDKSYGSVSAVYSNNKEQQINISTIKYRDKEKINKIGASVAGLSAIVDLAPTQIVHEGSSKLIFAEPEGRRKFLDWLVFYANEDYKHLWRDFNKILYQRNWLLKQAAFKTGVSFKEINPMFVWLSKKISNIRENVWQQYYATWAECLTNLNLNIEFKPEIQLFSGWRGDLEELLKLNLERDICVGYTSSGPHRADLSFVVKNAAAKNVLSRGQGKFITLSLIAARARFLEDRLAKIHASSVLLIDDLCAEIDNLNGAKIIDFLLNNVGNVQLVITGIQKGELLQMVGGAHGWWFEVQDGLVLDQ
jgi:DNA replication and repair protein RecF